jgi:uncharacterized protein YkwD
MNDLRGVRGRDKELDMKRPTQKASLITALLFLAGCIASPAFSSGDTARSCFDGTEAKLREGIVRYVNKERSREGLAPLSCDPVLSDVAQGHAVDMARRGYFSHTSPEGIDMFGRLAAADVPYLRAGENIAWGVDTARAVVALWMTSERHRANVLGDFTKVGVGAYRNYYVLLLIKE